MPLTALAIHVPTPPPPPDPAEDRKPLNIRCLLFFDGTLNNKGNIDERLQQEAHEKDSSQPGSAIYLKNRLNQTKEQRLAAGDQGIDLEDDSYENDFTNIVTLEANIAPQQAGYDERIKIYTEGAGTLKYTEGGKYDDKLFSNRARKKDQPHHAKAGTQAGDTAIGDNQDKLGGYAFSAGESGIKIKVETGLNDALTRIVHGPEKDARTPEEWIIKKLTFDIFGFSRGAASARYCVHRLLEGEDVEVTVGDEQYILEAWIKRKLRMQGYEVETVEICFVGLFDTVTSYCGLQIMKIVPLENWFIKLTAISKAQKVVHLASADEHRYHFSLHNINSAGARGEQYFFPGVHSDIGGSYLDNGSDGNLIVFEGAPGNAAQDRELYLERMGWFKKEQLLEEVLQYEDKESVFSGEPKPVQVRLRVAKAAGKARIVSNAYCNIPLKQMAVFAGKSGITIRPKLASDASDAINVYDELKTLETRIQNYITQVGPHGSKPEHWHMIEPELNAIRHKHLHFSARYNTVFGHNPRRSGVFKRLRKRYEFDG